MTSLVFYAVAAAAGYLAGSIPFGLIIAKKAMKIDIREHGSGNIGATNVWRVAGWKPGLLCFSLDILKGFLPVILFSLFFPERVAICAGLFAIMGHFFPLWLKGKGGKGIATGAGVFLGLAPLPLLYSLLAFFIIGPLATRTVSAGSIAAAVMLSFMTWQFASRDVAVLALIISAMAIYKHRSNIGRLYRGEESRIWKGLAQ